MDIATHAAMGLIAASPFVATRPGLATGLMFGSVLPDLDVLCRGFGKRAFLAMHQSWSHSLPVIVLFSAVVWFIGHESAMLGGGLALGLGLGMLGHVLLDVTNTSGVAVFVPFSRKRFCLEWVWFTDKLVMLFSVLMLALVCWNWNQPNPDTLSLPLGFFVFILIYWSMKGWLRQLAKKHAPHQTISLVPHSWAPWQFLGIRRRQHSELEAFRLNALSGQTTALRRYVIYDLEYERFIARLPEFQAMRNLSPAYHVVEAGERENGVVLQCRDLRPRRLSGGFGDLKIWLDEHKKIKRVEFRV
jgi:membrane-bound metal-dependent hydrolase YbcI (DUF457 family)